MENRTGMALVAAIALALALHAFPAFADPTLEDAYRSADRNGDGLLDRREFQQRMVDVFFMSDRDKNGKLEPSELPAASSEVFARADTNGGGQLELAEFLDARAMDFEAADTDGDGALSAAEAARVPLAVAAARRGLRRSARTGI